MQLWESPDISFYVRQDYCLIGRQCYPAVALLWWDGLELISFHYSQAWNCQLYDSHLISDVLSASSHHIKAGVTSFFATLTKCKLPTNDHWDTEGNLRENKKGFPNPKHTSALKLWSLLGHLPTSAHSSPVWGDSLQSRACNPQHSAAKPSHQVLVLY